MKADYFRPQKLREIRWVLKLKWAEPDGTHSYVADDERRVRIFNTRQEALAVATDEERPVRVRVDFEEL